MHSNVSLLSAATTLLDMNATMHSIKDTASFRTAPSTAVERGTQFGSQWAFLCAPLAGLKDGPTLVRVFGIEHARFHGV